MQVSGEARWFVEGPISPRALEWFRGGDFKGGGGKTRIDAYLKDKTAEELGIKLRAGKDTEVKALIVRDFATLPFGKGSVRMELWTKSASAALDITTLPIVQVAKVRWIRKFEPSATVLREVKLGAGPSGEDPEDGSRPDVGCNVELTAITTDERVWSSFGLEAFAFDKGPTTFDTLRDTLARTLRFLQETWAVLNLTGWEEMSYPRWLKQLS